MDKWNLVELKKLVGGDRRQLLMTLQRWGLIPIEGHYLCPKCSVPLRLYSDASKPEGWRWQCRNTVSVNKQKRRWCDTVVSFRAGTFFERLRTDLFKLLGFVNLWVFNASLKLIQCQLDVSYQTTVDWASVCRDVLWNAFVSNPEKLGGPGAVVEVGESVFRKPSNERDQWVFGGFERGTGRIFMVPVENLEARTLIPVIKTWIEVGTSVITHTGEAYRDLQKEGYNHFTVSQALNFEEPFVYAHINSMTSSWRAAKALMSNGEFSKTNIPGNLARYMFYKHCDRLQMDRTLAFFELAGKLYDPLNPRPVVVKSEVKQEELDDELIKSNGSTTKTTSV